MSFAALPNAIFFALAGVVVFAVSFVVLLRALPGRLWDRALEEDSLAAAVIVAALLLSIAWIVAAAVH